ncbi:Detected protein of unknown function [Hibiscus syriacus]|uniref:Uncharacterized protein n=1 Tax=Hibiscus syriacus TaxID=106335 RepID=A0A6A2ZTB7_HIBSY|nr:Detected protein of unknown function [Hibiscus syriacus]
MAGRHLRSKSSSKKCLAQPDDNSFKVPENGNLSVEEPSSKVENINDFRPTVPGHSPGAGHSIQTRYFVPFFLVFFLVHSPRRSMANTIG